MEDQSGAATSTVHRASDGLDGQHTVDKARGVNYTFYKGGQESRSGGWDSVSEDDQEGTEGASDGGSGRHGHKEGHWKVVAPACL
jgi:hypothetical protein